MATEIDTSLQRALPSGLELFVLVCISLLLNIVGNMQQIVSYYGLDASTHALGQNANGAIELGLQKLDSLPIISNLVLFAIWGAAGVLCLSVLRTLGRIYRHLENDELISSNRFVHPANFNRHNFWRTVGLDYLGLMSYLVLIGALVYCFVAFVLPVGLALTGDFFAHMSLGRIGYFLLGTALMFAGLTALYVSLKLLFNRHRAVNTPTTHV